MNRRARERGGGMLAPRKKRGREGGERGEGRERKRGRRRKRGLESHLRGEGGLKTLMA